MLHFLTSADGTYLTKAVCLIDSFQRRCSAGTFWFFARDPGTAAAMHQLTIPGVRVVEESAYQTPLLRDLRAVRSPTEYAWTIKSVILRYVMDRAAPGDWVFWIDGDMFFFQPAEQIVPE